MENNIKMGIEKDVNKKTMASFRLTKEELLEFKKFCLMNDTTQQEILYNFVIDKIR